MSEDQEPAKPKTISALVLSDAGNHSTLDLEDAARAVEVSLKDGLVTFREGFGPGRLHGWALTPDSVDHFEVLRVNGREAICLAYRRQEQATSRVIGYVEDRLTAEKWVERVNAVYVERNAARNILHQNRQTNFRDYPVVNDILQTGLNIVLPGSYQYSWQDQLPTDRLTLWEDAYVHRCIELLARQASIDKNSIELRVKNFIPHDYEWLSERVFYGPEDFDGRITHPLELIFDRQQRHDTIGVNAFSVVKRFAVVYFQNSHADHALGARHGQQVTETFADFLALHESIPPDKRFLLCAPRNQSVSFSFYDAHHAGKFDLKNLHRRYDMETLAMWLWMLPHNGAVVCDVGEVKTLINTVHKLRGGGASDLHYATIPYEHPIPVGFCFRKDDRMWAEIEREALIDVVDHPSKAVKDDFQAFSKRAAQLDVEVLIGG